MLKDFAVYMWVLVTVGLACACVHLHEQETTYLAAAADMLSYAKHCGYNKDENNGQ